jgi:hypothetical protein
VIVQPSTQRPNSRLYVPVVATRVPETQPSSSTTPVEGALAIPVGSAPHDLPHVAVFAVALA